MNLSTNISELLKQYKRYYCISVILSEDTTTFYGVLIRDESQGDFHIEDRFKASSLLELVSKNKNEYPILLNFEGNPIVSKYTVYQEGYLKKILFRANIHDFYIYEMIEDKKVYVSYTRKNMIDPILEDFANADFQVIRYTIGPFILKNILPYIGNDVSAIYTSYNKLTLSRKKITSFQSNSTQKKETYTLLNESISNNHITALSLFIEEKTKATYILGSEITIKKNKEDHYYKKIFKKGGAISIIIIISSLLIGHNLRNRKTEIFYEKQSEITYLQQSQATINKLTEDKKNKEYILTNSGFNKNTIFTSYISGITNSIPPEITLNSLEMQPLEKKVKPDEKVKLNFNTIKISGISNDDTTVDKWIDQLKKMPWIKRLEVTDYKRDKLLNGKFEITIEIS